MADAFVGIFKDGLRPEFRRSLLKRNIQETLREARKEASKLENVEFRMGDDSRLKEATVEETQASMDFLKREMKALKELVAKQAKTQKMNNPEEKRYNYNNNT